MKNLKHLFILFALLSVPTQVSAQLLESKNLIHPSYSVDGAYSVDWDDEVTTYIDLATGYSQNNVDSELYIEDIQYSGKEAWIITSYLSVQAGTEYIEIAAFRIPSVYINNRECGLDTVRRALVGETVFATAEPEPRLYAPNLNPADLTEWMISNGLGSIHLFPNYSDVRTQEIMTVSSYNELAATVERKDLQAVWEMGQFKKDGLWWQDCGDSAVGVTSFKKNVDNYSDTDSLTETVFSKNSEDSSFPYRLQILLSVFISIIFFFTIRQFTTNEDATIKPWLYTFSITTALFSFLLVEFSIVPLLAIVGGMTIVVNKGKILVGLACIALGGWFLMVNIMLNAGLV